MNNNGMKKVELNVGPQINFADAVESIEINDSTKLICNCPKVTKIITKSRYSRHENCLLSEVPSSMFFSRC